MLNTYNDGGAKNWSIQVHFRSSDSRVISDFDGNQLPMVRGRWVELRVEINLDTDLQTFYYDDQILYLKSWSSGVIGTGATAIAAVDLYGNNSSPIYYDDLSLKSASSTVLTSSANPSELSDDVLLTASVTSLTTVVIPPTGTVEFFEGATSLGTSPVNASGQAVLNLSGLSLGAHNFSAMYSGDTNYAPSSGALMQNVVDTVPPRVTNVNSNVDSGDGMLTPGEGTRVQITQLLATFSEDVLDPAGNTDPDDVTNTANYSLIRDPAGSATPISIDGAAYSALSRTATLDLNGGAALGPGTYRFIVRGTPSIQDSEGNSLDGDGNGVGGDDYTLDFNILPGQIPETGFAPGRLTFLPANIEPVSLDRTGIHLIIPKLAKDIQIVGVPLSTNGWDVRWLGNSVGYLEGTAFPTWEGNTLLTGHVYLRSGLPGPFVNLSRLGYGDLIQLEAWGASYTYFVFEKRFLPADSAQIVEHSELDWLTLITCRDYDPVSDTYARRTVIRAVLVKVNT